jgi:hypothetical protein
MRRLVDAYTAELGENVELSEVDQALIRQAATLTLSSERLAAEVVGGQPINGDQLVRISSELRRTLEMISARAEANKPAPVPFWQRRQAAPEDTDGD